MLSTACLHAKRQAKPAGLFARLNPFDPPSCCRYNSHSVHESSDQGSNRSPQLVLLSVLEHSILTQFLPFASPGQKWNRPDYRCDGSPQHQIRHAERRLGCRSSLGSAPYTNSHRSIAPPQIETGWQLLSQESLLLLLPSSQASTPARTTHHHNGRRRSCSGRYPFGPGCHHRKIRPRRGPQRHRMSRHTVVQASIGLNGVTVIARFDTGLNHCVTATSCDAIIEARIGLNRVPHHHKL